jgi:hypothetical protein
MTRTCTVVKGARGERCGAAAVYVEGEFAECAVCAATPGALALTRHMKAGVGRVAVGEAVEVRRHGKTYTGTVTRITRTGTVYATVTYGTGTTREVRV